MVRENFVTNYEVGIGLKGNARIVRNIITGNDTGIAIRPYISQHVDFAKSEFSQNAIYGNKFHMVNQYQPTITIKHNWWGQDPPDVTKFSGALNFVPWLKSSPVPIP